MEEEIKMAETQQGDAANGDSSGDLPNNSATKRGRGRPQGSKKLKVCVADVSLVSKVSNGGATQPQRKRGRPRLSDTKHGQESANGSKKQGSDEDTPITGHSPKKRGRPKKSLSNGSLERVNVQDMPNGGSGPPKMGRGRPKGSKKQKLESSIDVEENESSSATPKKRGRPKGSLNKRPKLEPSSNGESDADGGLKSVKRGRGRPKKVVSYSDTLKVTRRGRPIKSVTQGSADLVTGGSQPVKRGRGRPKGSFKKKHLLTDTQKKRRGRPRKYPLPSPEELNKPKVWKPLGRPKKNPSVDPPEGTPTSKPRQRKRGRPRKSEYGKGAHLRKSGPAALRKPNDGTPRKRGRPPGTKKQPVKKDGPPKKRGRPKGSCNKNKIQSETQLESTVLNHVKSDSSDAEYCEPVKEDPSAGGAVAHNSGTEEMCDQSAGLEVSCNT